MCDAVRRANSVTLGPISIVHIKIRGVVVKVLRRKFSKLTALPAVELFGVFAEVWRAAQICIPRASRLSINGSRHVHNICKLRGDMNTYISLHTLGECACRGMQHATRSECAICVCMYAGRSPYKYTWLARELMGRIKFSLKQIKLIFFRTACCYIACFVNLILFLV